MSGILIFGGAFDPPHLGHVQAVKDACAFLSPKKVLLIPTYLPKNKSPRFSYTERLFLTGLVFPDFQISRIEEEIQSSATVDVLTALSKHGAGPITFAMGSDQFLSLRSWKNFPEVLSLCNWLVLIRKGTDEEALRIFVDAFTQESILTRKNERAFEVANSRNTVSFLKTEAAEVSSSHIRSLLERKQLPEAKKLLPPPVFEYLERQNHG